jgi:hypothetical protein
VASADCRRRPGLRRRGGGGGGRLASHVCRIQRQRGSAALAAGCQHPTAGRPAAACSVWPSGGGGAEARSLASLASRRGRARAARPSRRGGTRCWTWTTGGGGCGAGLLEDLRLAVGQWPLTSALVPYCCQVLASLVLLGGLAGWAAGDWGGPWWAGP